MRMWGDRNRDPYMDMAAEMKRDRANCMHATDPIGQPTRWIYGYEGKTRRCSFCGHLQRIGPNGWPA